MKKDQKDVISNDTVPAKSDGSNSLHIYPTAYPLEQGWQFA